MGAGQSPETEKSFYETLTYVRPIDHSKCLMKDPATGQLYAVVEHTFPS